MAKTKGFKGFTLNRTHFTSEKALTAHFACIIPRQQCLPGICLQERPGSWTCTLVPRAGTTAGSGPWFWQRLASAFSVSRGEPWGAVLHYPRAPHVTIIHTMPPVCKAHYWQIKQVSFWGLTISGQSPENIYPHASSRKLWCFQAVTQLIQCFQIISASGI